MYSYQVTIWDFVDFHKHVDLTDAEITSIASTLAEEANESIEQARKLRRRIIEFGGISGSAYESIPRHYRRTSGYSLDCLAAELGYQDEDALHVAIQGAENVLRRLPVVNGKRVQKFRSKDFLDVAQDVLFEAYEDYDDDVPF